MAAVETTHTFVSAVSDTADPNVVQPSHWNADHDFSGDALGGLLVRDPGAAHGASWLTAAAAGNILKAAGAGTAPTYGPLDLTTEVTGALPVANGGTGATSASAARTALGLAIGVAVQAFSSILAAIAGGTWTGASSITTLGIVSTGTWQATPVGVAYGGTGAATAADARTALGLVIGSAVQAFSSILAAIAGGTWTGASSITTLGIVSTGTWQATPVGVANGGTGATSASAARTALGLAIGTHVQAYSSTLDAVAAGTYAGDDSITTVGTVTTGAWSGTPIPLAKGGTGATTAAAARTALGLVIGTDVHAAFKVNHIGTAGALGFGVGICPETLPAGMSMRWGTMDPTSDEYGNYQYSDGSIMVWIPAFYYKYGTGANGLAVNAISIAPLSAYGNVAEANTAGYALHRAFYDGGAVKNGVFVDKFLCSNNSGVASSIQLGLPLSSAAAHNPFAGLTGAPANAYYGAIAAAKTRGANFFCNTRFIFSALAMLSVAHGLASSSTAWCAWYHATNNFPKGCNNNALGDAQDAALTFVSDGYLNCAKTGSANYLARTTHNGQACGVADLNGVLWEITPGLATDTGGTTYYALLPATAMKNATGGVSLATDLWGAAGLAALYVSLGATFGAATASSSTKTYGNAAQVLSEATSGADWVATGLGVPLVGGVGGSNLFGNDILYDYRPASMCPVSGGGWSLSSTAGVWTLHLNNGRGNSGDTVGFRAALYL